MTAFKNRKFACKADSGFTLLEMSIVLAIIGFLTAGVLTGKSLLRQAQINSAGVDAQRYITATQNFKQQYHALPGDMPNATSFWGTMSTCPPTYGMTSPGGTLTCNGDGNSQVYDSPNPPLGTFNINTAEQFYFWQHLANANLIQTGFTGIAGSAGSYDGVIGVNIPAGRLPGIGFGITYMGSWTFGGYWFNANYGHLMVLGTYKSNNMPFAPILTTLEAQSFDNKYDDGLPATGNIMTFPKAGVFSPYCATTNVASTAAYNTAASNANSTGLQCSLIIITGF